MPESRTKIRKRCFLGARIQFNNRRSTFDCLVRDISEGGARLELATLESMPDEFDLVIPQHERQYRAKVVWRRNGKCGVRFLLDGAA
jgi:hypothetical protein